MLASLHTLFSPASMALVGASENAQGIGGVVLDALLDGGFGGELISVADVSVDVMQRHPNKVIVTSMLSTAEMPSRLSAIVCSAIEDPTATARAVAWSPRSECSENATRRGRRS